MKPNIVAPETVGMSAERLARIKPAIQRYVDQKKIAGLSLMVARKGQVVYFDQVGQMDIVSNKPMADDVIFRIYSMTKPIICTALMTLYEQNRFQLFDPVAKYIPAFGQVNVLTSDGTQVELAQPITIHHLLTHTAGLTYDFLEDSPVGELYREARIANDAGRSLAEMIDELTRLPLAFQPGSIWHYSVSIDVLAHLIEVLADQPLDQFLQETLFKPLGLIDTDFHVPLDKQKRLATMYGLPDVCGLNVTLSQLVTAWQNGFNEQIDVSTTYPATKSETFGRGGHGLFSTAADYIRFAQMLLNQGELDGVRILSRKTTELMHTNHLPAELRPYLIAPPAAYGYGFGLGSRVLINVAESQKPGSVGEFGWAGAAKTYFWVDPQEELIGILLSQSMMQFEQPEKDFQVLAYQTIVD